MEKIYFRLPSFGIKINDILNSFVNAGYKDKANYDAYKDWVQFKFAKGYVDAFNKKAPFKITLADIYKLEDDYDTPIYEIEVFCDKQELYDFLDKYLIDTQENYDVTQIISELETKRGGKWFEKILNEAWKNYSGDVENDFDWF